MASSLRRLGVSYIDSLVLHSLYPDMGDTLIAWRAMEALVPSKVSFLGLSNVDAGSLQQIYEMASVKPTHVQNRFTQDTEPRPEANLPPGLPYPKMPYDKDVREFCHEGDIMYVAWGVLWGNPDILDDDPMEMLEKTAQEIGISKQALYYACLRNLSTCKFGILCGTTKQTKMEETVDGFAKLDSYLQEGKEQRKTWDACLDHVKSIIDNNE